MVIGLMPQPSLSWVSPGAGAAGDYSPKIIDLS